MAVLLLVTCKSSSNPARRSCWTSPCFRCVVAAANCVGVGAGVGACVVAPSADVLRCPQSACTHSTPQGTAPPAVTFRTRDSSALPYPHPPQAVSECSQVTHFAALGLAPGLKVRGAKTGLEDREEEDVVHQACGAAGGLRARQLRAEVASLQLAPWWSCPLRADEGVCGGHRDATHTAPLALQFEASTLPCLTLPPLCNCLCVATQMRPLHTRAFGSTQLIM